LKENTLSGQLQISPKNRPDGFEVVSGSPSDSLPLSEQVVIRQIFQISPDINYIFFRHFLHEQSSSPVACIIDNTAQNLSPDKIKGIHHNLWLYGKIPLLYVENQNSVDIFSCMSKAVVSADNKWCSKPAEHLLADAADIAEKLSRYKISRLIDGTFWNNENKNLIDVNHSAHSVLIQKVIQADKELEGKTHPCIRRLLLLTILIKYLEDRGVFATENNWFSQYLAGAASFYDLLVSGNVDAVKGMFHALHEKFNGDIFLLLDEDEITSQQLKKIAVVVDAKADENGQLYFWNIYSFKYIPVEVLSHIYQNFSEEDKGAVFTPSFLVELMLDQAMPYDSLNGNETVFDPTCGSGIFLVSAYRRLVYVNLRNNNWNKLTPDVLKNILKKSVFGIEIQDEAAHITAFSLALALCDALLPKIIWTKLRFDNLVNRNIFIGDIGDVSPSVLNKYPEGFDIILGNPPFQSKLTPAIKKELSEERITIPDNQIAYYILLKSCREFLSENGRLCMIQPGGFLYNQNVKFFRKQFLSEFTTEKILDFISTRGLFSQGKADTKIIALVCSKQKPDVAHKISHLTFRRTCTVKQRLCFELDSYDYNTVWQEDAEKYAFVWKADLLGGGRLFMLAKRLSEYPTIEDFLNTKGWKAGEEFILGKTSKKKITADWLYDKPLVVLGSLMDNYIDESKLSVVKDNQFVTPHSKENYEPPLMIISETSSLKSGLYTKGLLAYTHKYIRIYVRKDEIDPLKLFFRQFNQVKTILVPCINLLGMSSLATRATATQKIDIMNLPWPSDNDYQLSATDREMLDDISGYMADYVRLGEESKLSVTVVDQKKLDLYCETYLRLMRKAYPDMCRGMSRISRDFGLQEFCFDTATKSGLFTENNWDKKLPSIITKKESEVLQTKRVLCFMSENSVYFIKPAKLRYWLKSCAIRDADETCARIMQGGK
jgi:hypothetical protein